MKNIKAWILIGIFAGSLLPTAENTLDRFRTDYVKSVFEGRPELSSPYYAERVRLMPEFQKTILGKASATAYDRAFAARFAVHEFRRDVVEILELGSRLMESGTFQLKMSVKKSGERRELRSKEWHFSISRI